MAKTLGLIIGVVFILVGILGFVPNNPIISGGGLFVVDPLHNLFHLITGIIITLVAVNAPTKSGKTLKIVGIVYILLAILGFLTLADGGDLLGLIAMNPADHWLHLVLGVVILGIGVMAKNTESSSPNPSGMSM